jgi:Flp pilus assembly protein TadD
MPALASTDVAHTEVTDHRIQRRPTTGPVLENAQSTPASFGLRPFANTPEAKADIRDLALAWASAAESGSPETVKKAEQLLRKALVDSPKDGALLSSLAYLEQKQGKLDDARELYQRALAQDAMLLDAAANLGVIEANSGHMNDAVALWQSVFERAPGRSGVGMNLAYAYCGAGKPEQARAFTMRVLQFNPDLDSAKRLMRGLNASPPKCAM